MKIRSLSIKINFLVVGSNNLVEALKSIRIFQNTWIDWYHTYRTFRLNAF